MQRIVLKHISGSKANQVEEFPISYFKELIIGRDPSSTIKYDPDRDDLVGRQHAKIVQDPSDPTQFMIADLNSRNGTFVNKQRIVGTAKIAPGDVVQFGAGGPEFQFDIEPRPQNAIRPTHVGTDTKTLSSNANAVPQTRFGVPPTATSNQGSTAGSMGVPPVTHGTVGKATVERMIAQNKSESSKYLLIGGAALLVIIALVAGGLYYYNWSSSKQLASDMANITSGQPMTPAEITKSFANSVVYVEAGWKLIHTGSGSQVYHMFIPNVYNGNPIVPDGRRFVACYVLLSDDRVEPYLTTDSRSGRPIGGEHSGSGFTVTSDGFILTNRHVAATWKTTYHFPENDDMPATWGVVIQGGRIMVRQDGSPFLVRAPRDWVPSETKQAGQKLQGGFEGRNDYLDVTFPKNEGRIPARLARVSDRHDVAMIKIEVPEAVAKVDLNDNYDTIKPGDAAIVLGYPAVSPPVFGVIKSQDVFNPETKRKLVPDPTVSVGNIGRLLRSQESTENKDLVFSGIGDAYQLTINSTGAGNSGGPVFDDRGRVIGIFFAGIRADASITFAVPIRYGKELMSVNVK